jgi:ABC-2 type transport system ATP-binding protein
MEEAERCDRLAIYAEGNVVAMGTPTELKKEIGGDVILLETKEPDALAQHIVQRFGLPATVLDNRVRLEIENGHRFVTDVVEAFPGGIEGVSVHKPSLEDVFIRRTGHRFWKEQEEQEKEK